MGGQACVFYCAAQVSKDAHFCAALRPRIAVARPLLTHVIAGDIAALQPALDAEIRAEQDKDRAYWEPLKRELESIRMAEASERRAE